MEGKGNQIAEGKTKIIYESLSNPKEHVVIVSKDDITAGNGLKVFTLPLSLKRRKTPYPVRASSLPLLPLTAFGLFS